MESELTWREKRAARLLEKLVAPFDRYIDIGVTLHVVVRDPDGEALVARQPNRRVRILRTYHLGGVLDTLAEPPRIVGPSRHPVTWLCSVDQEGLLFYDGRKSRVVRGSEGAGKSQGLAMLHYVWWLDLLGEDREIGQVAPTKARLAHVRRAMQRIYPRNWYRYSKADQLFEFADGHRVQFVSTKIVSSLQGSPLQGYSFSKSAGDELQNIDPDVTDDLESRGREAEDGDDTSVYTCTASENPAFRDLVARKKASGDWEELVWLAKNSPFITEEFLAKKRRVMTKREYERRYEAVDHPPERMLYSTFSRQTHLRPIPPGARDITSHILRRRTRDPRHALLVGHDPGAAKGASIFLKAFELRGIPDPVWWAVAEIFHEGTTTEQNADAILELAQRVFGCNRGPRGPQVHVRAHPFGQSEDKPSVNLYRIFNRRGLHTMAAQYKKDGTGTGLIHKEDRIELVKGMFLNADDLVRLYVDVDAQGQPKAPKLVASLEQMERDPDGKAETEKKDIAHDLSDPPAGLGYGLWPFESELGAKLARTRRTTL